MKAQMKLGLGHAVAYAIAGGLGLFLTISLAGCALETGPGDDGHGSVESSGGDNKSDDTTTVPPVAKLPNSQPTTKAGSAPAPGQDPQPSPWIGTATTNEDPGAPVDRQQMGTTVEHK